jgi:hypothetical protein
MAQTALEAEPPEVANDTDPAAKSDEAGPTCPLSDEDLLAAVRNEMQRSVGFENDQELKASREMSLNYAKGVMPDMPYLDNRSRAVDTAVADGVETVLPDLMEIFTGGEDIAAFIPNKEADEDGAKQETDYLTHVIFQDNPGFLNLCTGFKDALLTKVAVFNFWWEKDVKTSEERFQGKNGVEVQLCAQDGEIQDLKAEPIDAPPAVPDPTLPPGTQPMPPSQTFSFTLCKTTDNSRAKFTAVAPEDFSVSEDTVRIADTSYCCMRSRPRVQDMLADGYDADLVEELEPYSGGNDTTIQRARDTAGEHANSTAGDDSSDDLRQVEIRTHHIRLLDDKNKLCIWQVTTDNGAKTLLDKQPVTRIPYAAGSPYLVAHRFFGLSLADKLLEIQRIKTALRRAVLDSAYFALNQRMEVSDQAVNAFTISDLLNNEPGMPVRSKTGQALRPLSAGALGFDAYAALEYFSTAAEQATGVVRNAQGLNPDTLHDTAKGAMALLSAAQKRVRMIARILAETCIKELYLGMHAVLRENARSERIVKLNGKWVPVNPSNWGERDAMTIEVGLGASGSDVEIAAINQIAQAMTQIVSEQGGAQGPIVTVQNVYNAATDLAKKLGRKQPGRYFTDPSTMPPPQPKPNPDAIKAQTDAQLQQSKQQGDMQIAQMKVAADKEIEIAKAQSQAAVNTQQNQLEHERAQQQAANDYQLQVLELASKERIAIQTARINAEGRIAAAAASKVPAAGDAPLAFEETHESTAVT